MVGFVERYGNVNDVGGSYVRQIGEFIVDRFIQKVRMEGRFDRVFYLEQPARTFLSRGGYFFEFVNGGRSMKVYTDAKRSQMVTEITGMVIITKGSNENNVIIDPQAGRDAQFHYADKIRVVQAALGSDAVLSYMVSYTQDIFVSRLSSSGIDGIIPYLDHHPNNLVMVYSSIAPAIRHIGEKVLEAIRAKQAPKTYKP